MRIDMVPTDIYEGFHIRPGLFFYRGSLIVPGGVNFTIYSAGAKSCALVLFHAQEREPFAVIPYPESYRIGNVFSMIIFDLDYENLEYGFYIDGKYDVAAGYIFDRTKCLMDPYAKIVSGRDIWGETPDWTNPFQYRSKVARDDFDWRGDRPLPTPHNELIIYEMHVRGFTQHESSNAKYKGTFAALREKIPYLKELGVTAVELLPVFEFDEMEDTRVGIRKDANGDPLYNYWGYSTVAFFAPKAGYAASGRYSLQMDEFKNLIREMHKNDLKVILDVVFNHTAEGDERGPYISFKGIDNKIYYILAPDGSYFNFSGCGNTMNCNHPVVRNMILNCLRYWVSEYHVDGFRFDLASILGRSQDGSPMNNPPLLEALACDPLLANSVLIAEAWDAGGLYQVGSFPAYGRWAEWNGRYRDDLRRFLKGECGLASTMISRITGSEDIYNPYWRGDCASVNFITCHDGFTLWDLYSYNYKHNEANGWNNTDGANDNFSWNCGHEGETDDPQINELRHRMVKNAAAVLLVSLGIPMILAGDEFGNTQFGNNNPYCQDNEVSWLDWTMLEKNRDIYDFFKGMIAFRKAHPVLRRQSKGTPQGFSMVSLHGVNAWQFDDSYESHLIALMFAGKLDDGTDDFIYIGINAHWEPHSIWLPALPEGAAWKLVANTGSMDKSFYEEPLPLNTGLPFLLGARSVMVCVANR